MSNIKTMKKKKVAKCPNCGEWAKKINKKLGLAQCGECNNIFRFVELRVSMEGY